MMNTCMHPHPFTLEGCFIVGVAGKHECEAPFASGYTWLPVCFYSAAIQLPTIVCAHDAAVR